MSVSPVASTTSAEDPNRFSRRQAGRWLVTLALAPLLTGCLGRDEEQGDGYGIVDWDDAAAAGGTGAKQGDRAPNFRLVDLDDADRTLAGAGADGRPIVLNFFATWCASCREEMPVLSAAHGRDATVLGIDLRESAGRVRPLIAETGVTYPVLLDGDGSVTRAYNAIALPTTCVLAPDGTIRRLIVGPVTPESLAEGIALALA